jgi:hypothetical protein
LKWEKLEERCECLRFRENFAQCRATQQPSTDYLQVKLCTGDDSNISDHVGDLDIQSYQFEPLCNDESQQEREHSTSEDSDIDESSQAQDRLVNTDW